MSIFSKIFKKENPSSVKIGGMEDFMTLIRVYFQSVMAADLGVTNMAALPDLRVFKTTLHIPTANNKLGVNEKSRCRKMLKDLYGMDDGFCKEIDMSVKKNCRRIQDIQAYMYQFQAFSQDIMMLTGNLMKLKLRLPSFFKKALYQMTEKTVNDIFTKVDYKDAGVMKTCLSLRQINKKLGFSQKWTTDLVYRVVMLAKKEKQPKADEK